MDVSESKLRGKLSIVFTQLNLDELLDSANAPLVVEKLH